MSLEKKAKEHLEKLLVMSQENFKEMNERWVDLENDLMGSIRKSHDFRIGYVFGKIEHKFISWFYSEYGRAQTDAEYEEFWKTVKEYTEKHEK